jgi:hypothetical protein
MNRKIESVPTVVPPALDVEESELAARNEFLAYKDLMSEDGMEEFTGDGEETDEIVLDETDAAPGGSADEREAEAARRAKRRKSLLFLAAFGSVFGVFVLFLSWAFGFGFFAPASRVAVDRNQKTSGARLSPNATSGDEKLKTALALVANDTASNKDAPVISDNSTDPNAPSEQDLKLSSDGKTSVQSNNLPSGNMIVLPDESGSVKSNGSQNQIRVSAEPLSQGTRNASTNLLAGEVTQANSILQPNTNNDKLPVADRSDGAVGRSIFFGSIPVKNDSVSKNTSGNFSSRATVSSNEATAGAIIGRDLHSARIGRSRANGTFPQRQKGRILLSSRDGFGRKTARKQLQPRVHFRRRRD